MAASETLCPGPTGPFHQKTNEQGEGKAMKTSLDFRNRFLCVLCQNGAEADRWLPVSKAEPVEAYGLIGRPLTQVDPSEGIYVDEEGNVYQLMDKGETKPIEVEDLSGGEKSELEVLLEASLNGRTADGKNGGPKRLLKKNRSSGRKQQTLEMVTAKPELRPAEAPPAVETSAATFNVVAPEDPARLISGRSSPRSAAASATSRSAATTSASTTVT